MGKAFTALQALPAKASPVLREDQAARAVLEDRAVLEGPAVQADRVALEDRAVRVVLEARVDRAVPVGGDPEEDRGDPAGTSDPAVSTCGLPGINN
jgi:hypothetical protein